MTGYRILAGLPASGPRAQPFPVEFGRLGREGFVVEICPVGSPAWVGSFRRGLTTFSTVRPHPNGRDLLVVAGGQGYIIEPTTRALLSEVGAAIIGVSEVGGPPSLLLDHQGIAFERLGAKGRLWRTRRLSWDGFRDVTVTADAITGLGWHAPTATWQPFDVDLHTGRTRQGVYEGPDLTQGEVVIGADGSAA